MARTPSPTTLNDCQAARVIRKFGSPQAVSSALRDVGLRVNVTTIYRWMYPAERGGTGGLIPNARIPDLKRAARLHGVLLTAEDWQW